MPDAQKTEPDRFDLIIVGSGSGNSIPPYLADWNIAIVERDVFGGTCLNRGCIPSKMFVVPADIVHDAEHAGALGVDVRFHGADWASIRDRVFGRIDAIADAGRRYRLSGASNLELIEGTARFVGHKVLDVDGRRITAPQILIAAGARPVVPPVQGLPETGFHTSDSIMRLDALPERLGIIGGGFIAAEFGHVFSSLGTSVSIFNRSDRLLRTHDDEIALAFTQIFSKRVTLHLNHVPHRVERQQGGIVLHCADGPVEVDELLVATGREPNSDLLDAERGGLRLHHHGTIAVDEHLRTSVPGVWAIGDIANEHQLKHVANAEARVAFWNIAHPDDLRSVDHKAVPAAVFSNPQVASVGLTERQAVEERRDHVVGRRHYSGTAYGWATEDTTSFCKVIVERGTGLILGTHILGPHASILIQPMIQAIQFGQTARDVAHAQYWIHPSLTEVVENALLDALAQI